MEECRANPDELLNAIRKEYRDENRGHLKIFFGYAAGVGKTYAMLKAAHAAKRRGVDVVIGYVEPHARPQTASLMSGLEKIPNTVIVHNNISLKEFDLDAAIKRKPKLILVDELAHTNATGSRHVKRYQDINELLKAGIDVYTTVNVQHIESLNNMVASITGVVVRERIPDKVFDDADQVELVDIEPQELLDRLNAGHIYKKAQIQNALTGFFSLQNLVALREMALRRCADRVNKISETVRIKHNDDYYTDEHILVCLSSSPSNAKIIRTAARMAQAFRGTFTALFVETNEFAEMSDDDKKQLRANIYLAEQLGATIETTYGDDIPYQIHEFARLSGVSKIVLGRNNAKRKYFFSKPTLTEKLISYSPNLDVYIIPDKETPVYREQKKKIAESKFQISDVIKTFLIVIAATIIGLVFERLGFSEANIITVYILGVLITSVVTSKRIYSLAQSFVSVLVFNLAFTEPKLSKDTYDSGYPATFLIMFIAAFITSSLSSKINQNAKHSAQTAYRTKVLFDTNYLLQQADEKDEIITVTASQLIKLLDRDIVFYYGEDDKIQEPKIFYSNESESDKHSEYISDNERAVAAWVYKNNKKAGASTNTLSNSKCLYLAVRINESVYGVAGIVIGETPLDSLEQSIMLSMLGECALALENERNIKEKEDAAVLAKNEQLRANLLRAISHDLRTPLTAISGNASILYSNSDSISDEKKKSLYSDIYDDSLWLINLVENLLSVTRIEDGSINIRMTAELIDEVVEEAISHIGIKNTNHKISIVQSDEFLMVKIDARLICQVIINIVGNAIKYTPEGSEIKIILSKEKEWVVVEIADNGPGISDESKPKIFDMFYTDENAVVDSRRGLGFGLALCKSIINAHGGTISVLDNKSKGAIFRFTIPAEEVAIHE